MANPRGTSRNLERAMNGLSLTTNYNTGSASTADDYTTDNDGTDIMTPPDSGVDTSRFYHSSPDTRGGDQVSQVNNL
jgi:hypothetical protein